jgi:cytochrome d ubiquinol oxidase subunit I
LACDRLAAHAGLSPTLDADLRARRTWATDRLFRGGFNPSTPSHAHVINAAIAWLHGCAIGVITCSRACIRSWRASVSAGLSVAAIASVAILVTGHFQAVEVANYQPVKMAAMEGHWEDGPMPLGLVGFVNVAGKSTTALEVPGGVSFLDSGTFTKSFKGLNSFKSTDLPPLQTTYQTYHLMTLTVVLLLIGTLWMWALNRSGQLEKNEGLLKLLLWFWLIPELNSDGMDGG